MPWTIKVANTCFHLLLRIVLKIQVLVHRVVCFLGIEQTNSLWFVTNRKIMSATCPFHPVKLPYIDHFYSQTPSTVATQQSF